MEAADTTNMFTQECFDVSKTGSCLLMGRNHMKCVFIFYKDIIKGHWWFYGGFLRSLGFWKTLDDFWASTRILLQTGGNISLSSHHKCKSCVIRKKCRNSMNCLPQAPIVVVCAGNRHGEGI